MKTIFAVTFILVMGVGCGKEETPQKPETATKQAELTEMEKFAEELVRNARIQREKALVLGEKERADLFLDMATNQLGFYDKAFEIAEKENLSTDKNATTTAAPKAKKPEPPKAVPVNIANPIVEKAIRKELKKPTGELTKADLEKVTFLDLSSKQLAAVPKGLEKCAQLRVLDLGDNSDLTKAQITKLQKALPNCTIVSNPTKYPPRCPPPPTTPPYSLWCWAFLRWRRISRCRRTSSY